MCHSEMYNLTELHELINKKINSFARSVLVQNKFQISGIRYSIFLLKKSDPKIHFQCLISAYFLRQLKKVGKPKFLNTK